METFYIAILVGSLLVLAAALSSLLAFRFGAPLLFLFLLIGLFAGVDGLGIDFENFDLAFRVGSIALAVILFDSGFGTPVQAFRQAAAPAMLLASVGVIVTSLIVAVPTMLLLKLNFAESLLLGAIVASTDAAAVFFLLRIGGITIRDRVRSTLEVESGTNDPMAIFLTMAIAAYLSGHQAAGGGEWAFAIEFLREMVIGGLAGWIGGTLIVLTVNRYAEDRGLAPIFVLAIALAIFSCAGALGGSGFLAVYVAGLLAGNRKITGGAAIRRFLEGMTWLAQIVMFLVLGLLATPSSFLPILLPSLAIGLILMLVARPLATFLCLVPFDFTHRERGFIAWVGLRGAVSILLAIIPLIDGLDHGRTFFNAAFIIVLLSLMLQGWTIRPVAKALGLIIPARQGAIDKVELDLPGAAHHELLSYRVVAGSPVLTGERLPRWARPSLVIRDGRSMRYQYAGHLQENDHVYLFVAPSQVRLLDRLFASRLPVDEDDQEFFGAFSISPHRPASELDAIYGPGLLRAGEQALTVGDLMIARLGGQVGYADRLRLGSIILIVRDVDQNGHITSIGISLEAVEPAREIPLVDALARRLSKLLRRRSAQA